jgi:hypothetical protein
MQRFSIGFTTLLAGAFMLLTAAAQADNAMKATAPEHMTPPGESKAMQECNELAMERHVKMEERTRFVQDCIAEKMKK